MGHLGVECEGLSSTWI